MTRELGSYNTSGTRTHVRFQFSTHAAAGGNVAPSSAFEAADIRIYRANDSAAYSATQRSSANGITMTSPFDSLTGVHDVDIDLADNTDAGFYAAGYRYSVVLAPDETVDSQTITGVVLAEFEIGPPPANVTQLGGTATPVTNMTTVFSTDFAANYNTTNDCWVVKLGDYSHGGTSANTTLGTLTVGGTTSLAAVTTSGTVTFNAFTVSAATTLSGAVSLGSTLGVTGTTTLAALTTTGTVTMNALTVSNATTLSGAVSLGSTLGVTGTTTLAALTTTGTVTMNALTVSNATTLSGAVSLGSTLGITGAITATNASNNLTLGTFTVTTNAIAWNASWDAEVQSEVDDALKATLTEGYRSTGAVGSVRDMLYEIIAHMGNSAISGTTKTLEKLDKSTTAKTYTLDSATTPTAIEETT